PSGAPQHARVVPRQVEQGLLRAQRRWFREAGQIAEPFSVKVADPLEERLVVVGLTGLWGRWRLMQGDVALVVDVDHERALGLQPDVGRRLAQRQAPQVTDDTLGHLRLMVPGHRYRAVGALPERGHERR